LQIFPEKYSCPGKEDFYRKAAGSSICKTVNPMKPNSHGQQNAWVARDGPEKSGRFRANTERCPDEERAPGCTALPHEMGGNVLTGGKSSRMPG